MGVLAAAWAAFRRLPAIHTFAAAFSAFTSKVVVARTSASPSRGSFVRLHKQQNADIWIPVVDIVDGHRGWTASGQS
jgi:hypothetical protein